ncbi:hypothetical protein KUV51_21270 [Tateyamaria omphalii]|uniref:hypothetical protein n=1 Tax=Tateyamaria omphalii TaxID=299262 RepID=UPI001C996720|nr:hypothetical protein [Tateyamaria omphalii]MBY5935553.1 hypothetical protein [Tateyamaria omphalii]
MMASGPKTSHAAPSRTASRTALIVLGMHRSGTSLLTRVLSLMGADLPETLIGPSPNNPTGYWESRALRDFNDRLLALTGSRWDDWRALPDGWERSPKVAEFAEEAASLLDTEFGTSRFLVLKDPRVSRLMPFWEMVLETAGLTPRPLLALRNPIEVAASLKARNDFAPELSHLLWLRYMLEAERATRGQARVVISYDGMMQNWAGAMDRVTKGLDLVWPRGQAQVSTEVGRLISPDHRHHVSDESQLDSPLVSDWLRDAYGIFEHWATKQERKADHARLDAIRADLDASVAVFAPLVDGMRDTQTELTKRIGVIQDNQARIKELAKERREAEAALIKAQHDAEAAVAEARRMAQAQLADSQSSAATALTEAQRAAAKARSEADAARMESAKERRLKEQATAQLDAHMEAQTQAQAEAATLQTRVMQKLQQEIEIEAARADAAEEDFKARLQARTKAQTKTLRARLDAQNTELETARAALTEQEDALIALQADSAEKAAHLSALQNSAMDRDMVIAEQEAALDTARASLAERDVTLAEQDAHMAEQATQLTEQTARLAEQETHVTTLQEALSAAESAYRTQADSLAETQSALAQKDAELTDTRRALNQAESTQQEADQHAQTLSRINKSLKREADLEHAHVQSLTRENVALQKSANEAQATIARLRASHEAEMGALKAQLAQATAHTETRHSELAQLTNLLMQTETQTRQAQAERDAAQKTLTAMQEVAEETEKRLTEAADAAAKATMDVATLRAGQADLAAVFALLQPYRHVRFWRRNSGQLRRQMDAVRRSGLFDADWYLHSNPDVAETGMDPLTHFILYGLAEGRAPREPKAPQPPVAKAEGTEPAPSTDSTGAPQ